MPQDPKDEPASVLLNRIAAGRQISDRTLFAERKPKSIKRAPRRTAVETGT